MRTDSTQEGTIDLTFEVLEKKKLQMEKNGNADL